MNLGAPRFLHVPMPLVRAAARIGEFVPGTLLDRESLGMLVRGNTASPDVFSAVLERPPREPASFVESDYASAIAAQARLRWLLPLLRAALAFVWIFTGVVSLALYPVAESFALLARVHLEGAAATIALYGAALIDILFGIGIYVLRRGRQWLWRAQMLVILAYTALITLFLPEFWVHPYGPVLKNLPLLAAILLLHEFEPRASRVEP
jgi:DoxX-like family